ncbi:MAG TPA: hypothetical protein VGM11_05150, partial [Acidobacteriaceae bacterium]
MVVGIPLHAFTILHVVISIIELIAGVVVGMELLAARRSALTGLFLATAALTTITSFLFPFHGMTPGIVLAIVSLPLLLLAAVGLYGAHLRGAWRTVYVI